MEDLFWVAEDTPIPAESPALAEAEGNSALVPAEFPSPVEDKVAAEVLAEEKLFWAAEGMIDDDSR